MGNLLEKVISWSLALTAKFGYGGIFISMMLESAAIPIPSEVVLPFAGFLAASDKLNFWLAVFITTFANLLGSMFIYYIGLKGGRPLLEKYGKYILVHHEDIAKMDRWLNDHGARVAFFSRLLPGIRTFSSLVIGASRVNFNKFCWFTLIGSFFWDFPLVYIGFIGGSNWDRLRPYFHKFELAITILIIVGIAIFVLKHLRRNKKIS